MPKKTILVTGTTFPRWENDTEPRFVYDLAKQFAKKYKIIILVPHHFKAKKYEEKEGMRICRFPYFYPSRLQKLCYDGGILPNIKKSFLAKIQIPFLVAAELFAIRKIVKKENIDFIHAHWIVPQGFIAAIIKKLYSIPYIVTAHAGDVFPLRSRFLRFFGKVALNNCSYCTVNSGATRKSVLNVLNIKNVSIIPMGVDLSEFSAKKKDDSIRKRYHIKYPFILSVGRLAEKKGIPYLIKAMPYVIEKLPNTKLMIIGDGPKKEEISCLVNKLGINDNIIFIGKIPNKELAKYYASCDVFVLPSIITEEGDTEGLGVVLLEALASGTAVIGSSVGGIPDIIKDGKTGLLTEQKNPEDISRKIIYMTNHKKKRKDFIERGQKLIKKRFSWSVVADDFFKVYNEVMKR